MFKNNKGFTLIELLVVIAIIGILSSVVLASLNSARKKARDARRIADLKQLQLALEMYNDTNSSYPTNLSSLVSDYIPVLPKDPKTNADYSYATTSTSSSYVLGATLENYNAVLKTDIDNSDESTSVNCGTQDTGSNTAEREYCVMP